MLSLPKNTEALPFERKRALMCHAVSLPSDVFTQSDKELQTLLEASGGDGNFYVLEQLDMDGDGEVTWMEFEAMLGDR